MTTDMAEVGFIENLQISQNSLDLAAARVIEANLNYRQQGEALVIGDPVSND